MRYRSPLANARGLGSAKEGTHHFWMQRLTAVALVPLLVWFVAALVSMATADHASATAWVASPWVTILLIVLVVALFQHAHLGLQVVIEDYVHAHGTKVALLVSLKLAAVLLGAACVVSVLRIALGSA